MKKIMMTLLLAAYLLNPVIGLAADDTRLAINANTTMKELLTGLTGKRVALRVDSGDEVEGTVVMVGNSLVHLSRLSGKEFYDSVMPLEKISAIRVRVADR